MFWQYILGNQIQEEIVSGSGHRYWRFMDFHSTTDSHTGMSELHLYDDLNAPIAPVSHTYSKSGTSNFSVLWDDDQATDTVIYNGFEEWIAMDFGSNIEPTGFRMKRVSYGADGNRIPSKVKVQFSDDNTNWTTVIDILGSGIPEYTEYVSHIIPKEEASIYSTNMYVVQGIRDTDANLTTASIYAIEGIPSKNAKIINMNLYVIEE